LYNLILSEKDDNHPDILKRYQGDVLKTITKQDPTKDEAKKMKEMKHGN